MTLLDKVGRRLLTFGASGKSIMRFAATLPMAERPAYLLSALEHLKNWVSLKIEWRYPPVDVRCFVESSEFLNQRDVIYPMNMVELIAMNCGQYVETVNTGSIGTGKSSLAYFSQAYQVYVLSCLFNPQRTFSLALSSEIMIVFQSVNATLAKLVDYERFKALVDSAPYFQDVFPYDTSRDSEMRFPNRIIVKPLTGAVTAALGQNVIGGVIDECLVAGTQVLTPQGDIPIELIKAGDEVVSVNAEGSCVVDRVVKVRSTGIKPVFSIVFSGGKTIVGTANHPIATPEGWRSLGRLLPGEEVYCARPQRSYSLCPMEGAFERASYVQADFRDQREDTGYETCSAGGSRSFLSNQRRTETYAGTTQNSRCCASSTYAEARVEYKLDPRNSCESVQIEQRAVGFTRSVWGASDLRSGCEGKDCCCSCRGKAQFADQTETVRLSDHLSDGGRQIRGRERIFRSQVDQWENNASVLVRGKICKGVRDRPFGEGLRLRSRGHPLPVWENDKKHGPGLSGGNDLGRNSSDRGQTSLGCRKATDQARRDEGVRPEEWDDFSSCHRERVVSVTRLGESEVFNFETERTHTYIANGVVAHNCNFFPIIEKSKQSADGNVFNQVLEVYNSIVRRRKSRFLMKGRLFGLLCLVSSKRYPGEFTDQKAEEARRQIAQYGKSDIYVSDRRLWDVKPEGTYSSDTFQVFCGDAAHKPRIMAEGEILSADLDHLVVDVPIDFRSEFDRDLLSAIRDIAGMATLAIHPYILDTDAVNEAFGQRKSILSRDDCDFVDTTVKLFPGRIERPKEPRFAHIDLGLTGDSAGLAVGHVSKFMEMQRGGWSETLPIIEYDLLLEVKPPKQGEISFTSIRQLIYTLRDLGMNLKWVSLDSYQSRDTIQILSGQNFVAGMQSMDVDTIAYDILKAALYDRRVRSPACARAQLEITRLERDPKKGKIDHPPGGSKDLSDAMAGVAYGLTMRREIWLRHGIPITKVPSYLLKSQAKAEASDARKVVSTTSEFALGS